MTIHWDVVGVTLYTAGSILTTHAIGDALFTHPVHSVSEETHPAVSNTGTALLELGESADGRVSSFNAPSKSIGLETGGTCHHTDCLVVEEVVGTDSLADVVPVFILTELALVGPGTSGLGCWVEGEALNAVEAVGG